MHVRYDAVVHKSNADGDRRGSSVRGTRHAVHEPDGNLVLRLVQWTGFRWGQPSFRHLHTTILFGFGIIGQIQHTNTIFVFGRRKTHDLYRVSLCRTAGEPNCPRAYKKMPRKNLRLVLKHQLVKRKCTRFLVDAIRGAELRRVPGHRQAVGSSACSCLLLVASSSIQEVVLTFVYVMVLHLRHTDHSGILIPPNRTYLALLIG